MLRLYYQHLSLITRRNTQFHLTSAFSHNLSSSVDSNNDNKTEEDTKQNSDHRGKDVNQLLKQGERHNLLVNKAAEAIINISELKRESKISEADYKSDERFVGLLKSLESQHVTKLETMAIIRSLKVHILK